MKRKICFISAGLKAGGQERHLVGLANYYSKEGFEVTIINLFKTDVFFQIENCNEIVWPQINREKYHRLIYALFLLPYIRKNIRRIKPDVILSFGEWFSPYVIFSTFLIKIPVYPFEMMGPKIRLGILLDFFRKLTYRCADGIIVQTNIAKEILLEKIKVKRIAVIPTPLNPINANVTVKKCQIISVGRLSKEKGHIVLLQAFAKIKNKNWTLHLIGDGPEKVGLENMSKELGIYNRTYFYGFLKDFSEIIGESEIFVLPSFYEGFPNALIEAMSVPIACVSSNCVAGPKDIIEEGVNGLLVETGNVEKLVNSLDYLIENSDIRVKLANEAYKIRETLNFEKIATQYLNFIFINE